MNYKQLMIVRTNEILTEEYIKNFPRPDDCYVIFECDESHKETKIEWIKPKECDIKQFNEIIKQIAYPVTYIKHYGIEK